MYCVRRFSSILAGTAVVLCVFCLLGSTLVASAANVMMTTMMIMTMMMTTMIMMMTIEAKRS